MTRPNPFHPDPKLDLVLERIVDVPREFVWAAWTMPEHIKQWYTPEPWKTVDCEIDLRPGGMFRTVVRSPEGVEHVNLGCYLEVTRNERLIWTDALTPGYRPSLRPPMNSFSFITAMISLESHGKGTKYTATAIHKDEEDRKKHAELGFYEGWGTVLDQLVALARKMGV